jgi:hypothetical protein
MPNGILKVLGNERTVKGVIMSYVLIYVFLRTKMSTYKNNNNNFMILNIISECGKWSLSADVTSLLAGSVSTSPGSNSITYNCNYKLLYSKT